GGYRASAGRRRPAWTGARRWTGSGTSRAVGNESGLAGRRGSADAQRWSRREQIAGVRISLDDRHDASVTTREFEELRGDLPRHRELDEPWDRRHAALVGLQYPGHGERSA